jgi:hypothetical protein
MGTTRRSKVGNTRDRRADSGCRLDTDNRNADRDALIVFAIAALGGLTLTAADALTRRFRDGCGVRCLAFSNHFS